MKIIGVIPARFQSSRFEGKPLADICGKLMIERVFNQAQKVRELSDVIVATDDERIYAACAQRSIHCMMTSAKHKTGTDRVCEIAQQIKADLYVNIQGDEPLIEPETIKRAVEPFWDDATSPIQVTNLMTRIYDPVDLINPTVPKVLVARDGRGIFLTRTAAPFPKGDIDVKYYKQVCVYGFTPEALQFYRTAPRGKIEAIEDIEILRFIEAGYYVKYIEVASETIAVDTPSDLLRVRKYIEEKNLK